jgi:ABC-type bacteriocin/lantibiotic exporter with double-glycine peptidase domain
MACERAGMKADAEEVARLAGEAEGQTSMAGLARAARQLGFRARAEAWTVDEIFDHGAALAGRTILHMSVGHFVLLTAVHSGGVAVADPTGLAKARTRLGREELAREWSGRLLVLRGVPGGQT